MLDKLVNVLTVVTARTGRPEPVMKRAQVASAITAVAMLAAQFGIDVSGRTQEWAVRGVMAAVVVAPLIAAFHGRKLVTALDDPTDFDGTPLQAVPAGHVVVHRDVADRGVAAAVNDAAGTAADVAIDQTTSLGHIVGGIKDVLGDLNPFRHGEH